MYKRQGVYPQFLFGETSVLRIFNQRMMHFLQSRVDGYEDRPHSYEPMTQGVSGSDPSPSQGSVPQTKRGRSPEPESLIQSSLRLLRRSEHGRVPRHFF